MQNHWKYLINKNFVSVLFTLIPITMVWFSELEPKTFFWFVLAITICIFFVPVLRLHFAYLKVSKNLQILPSGIMSDGNLYLFEDISKIRIHKPRSIDDFFYAGPNYNPVREYFFVELIFKDKTKVFVTSLFSDEIDTILLSKNKDAEVFREDGMFANFPEW